MNEIIYASEFHTQLKRLKKPPSHLYFKGNKELLNKEIVAIVGSRNPNVYAQHKTEEIASKLSSRGIVIVSGGALGVDAIAHKSAGIEQTIAVLPTPIEKLYPATNANMLSSIGKQGLLLSQFEPQSTSNKSNFVIRNEIVVALSIAVVIIQADLESGTMRSTAIAQKLGVPIYVVPHNLGTSLGGAKLLATNRATAIWDIDAFVSLFGSNTAIKGSSDELLNFATNTPMYDECVAKFGSLVYEYELQGLISVRDGRVFIV